jgi:hypothetical protein
MSSRSFDIIEAAFVFLVLVMIVGLTDKVSDVLQLPFYLRDIVIVSGVIILSASAISHVEFLRPLLKFAVRVRGNSESLASQEAVEAITRSRALAHIRRWAVRVFLIALLATVAWSLWVNIEPHGGWESAYELPDPAPAPAEYGTPVLSPSGALLAAPSFSGQDWRIVIWRLSDRRVDKTLNPPVGSANVTTLLFSPDESQLIAASSDGELQSWDIRTGSNTLLDAGSPMPQVGEITAAPTGPPCAVLRVAFDPQDPTRIAVARQCNRIEIWDLRQSKVVIGASTADEADGPTVAAFLRFRSDGRQLALVSLHQTSPSQSDLDSDETIWRVSEEDITSVSRTRSPQGVLLMFGHFSASGRYVPLGIQANKIVSFYTETGYISLWSPLGYRASLYLFPLSNPSAFISVSTSGDIDLFQDGRWQITNMRWRNLSPYDFDYSPERQTLVHNRGDAIFLWQDGWWIWWRGYLVRLHKLW